MRRIIILSILFCALSVSADESTKIDKKIREDVKDRLPKIQEQTTYNDKYIKFTEFIGHINGQYYAFANSVDVLSREINTAEGTDKDELIKKRDQLQLYVNAWSAVTVAFDVPVQFFILKKQDSTCESIEEDIKNYFAPRAPVLKKVELSDMTKFSIDLAIKMSLDLCKGKPNDLNLIY